MLANFSGPALDWSQLRPMKLEDSTRKRYGRRECLEAGTRVHLPPIVCRANAGQIFRSPVLSVYVEVRILVDFMNPGIETTGVISYGFPFTLGTRFLKSKFLTLEK